MSTELIKLRATADILGGDVFFANDNGCDPENPSNDGLLANGMYIRLNGSDGSIAYISAYELDKAIDIIGEMSMSKANASDVEVLRQELASKVSSINFDLLQTEVNNKASKSLVDEMQDTIAVKANQSTVDEIIETLNAKASQSVVEELRETLNAKASQSVVEALEEGLLTKADADDVEAMLADINELKKTVQTLTNVDSINAINNQITFLNSEIQRRLTIDDLASINSGLANANTNNAALTERVEVVEVNLNKKASTTYVQSQVSELNTAITGVASALGGKADKTDLLSKANKDDFEAVAKKVNTITSQIADIELDIDNNYDSLNTEIAKKANKNYVDTKVEEFTNELSNKADKTTVNDAVSRINNKLQTLEDTHFDDISRLSGGIENVECEVNNAIATINATVSAQVKQISNHTTQITKLQESNNTANEKLKQSWVRVLTTNEYKKLRTAPEGVPYNDRYKYPNIVYLVVDFNKPKAIYIGDILVAQAEQKGSIGFAYTFPIVF